MSLESIGSSCNIMNDPALSMPLLRWAEQHWHIVR